jgi:RNA polymerase sigma-70 factor (family 1)
MTATAQIEIKRSTNPSGDRAELLLHEVLTQGSQPAFKELFHLLYKPLCRYCKKFVSSMDVAEEVVGDVFFMIWKNKEKYEIQTSAISYLFTATRNRAYDYLRKMQRDRTCELDQALHLTVEEPSSQELLEANEMNAKLRVAINSLPDACRKIFCLSRDQGLKYHEIATLLAISPKTVETQMGRALKQVRAHFNMQVAE